MIRDHRLRRRCRSAWSAVRRSISRASRRIPQGSLAPPLDADGLRRDARQEDRRADSRRRPQPARSWAAERSEQVTAIDEAAREFGLAFQIVDDILDVEGASADLGKTAGKDAAAGKPTYPSLYGLDASRRMAAECLERAEARAAPRPDSRTRTCSVSAMGGRADGIDGLTNRRIDDSTSIRHPSLRHFVNAASPPRPAGLDRGLAPSRERARALILAGAGPRRRPAGDQGRHRRSTPTPTSRWSRPTIPYVGRGGLKLAHALDAFRIDVAGREALDIGASTGGFTDVLLQRGAARVVALDVGHGQLDWTLRNDPRVVVIEHFNARHLTPADLPGPVDFVVHRRLVHLAAADPAGGPAAAAPGRRRRRAGEAAVRGGPRRSAQRASSATPPCTRAWSRRWRPRRLR